MVYSRSHGRDSLITTEIFHCKPRGLDAINVWQFPAPLYNGIDGHGRPWGVGRNGMLHGCVVQVWAVYIRG